MVGFTETDRTRIHEAVLEAERRTAAEILVVVAEACGSYWPIGVLWAAVGALFTGALTALAMPSLTPAQLIASQGMAFLIVAAALTWRPILMRTVPRAIRRAHARVLADHQFAARVAGRTEGDIGILLFVALAEREIFILPDAGLAAKIEAARWNGPVLTLVREARAGTPASGIIAAVAEIASILEPLFPPEASPRNAIADEVVELEHGTRSSPARE